MINMDALFANLTLYKFAVLGGSVILGYLIVLLVYGAAAQSIYKKKHNDAKQNVKRYYRMLGHLNKLYKKENM